MKNYNSSTKSSKEEDTTNLASECKTRLCAFGILSKDADLIDFAKEETFEEIFIIIERSSARQQPSVRFHQQPTAKVNL